MTSVTAILGVTVLTLVVTTLVGIRHSRGNIETVEALVTADNTAGIPSLSASLIASVLGTWVLFNPPEATVEFGGVTATLGYAVGLALPLALFASVGVRIRELVPHGHSVTEFVLARYGRVMYLVVLVVSASYMFVFLTVELTAIAAVLAIVGGIPPPVTAGTIGLFVLAYTGYGGLIASIVTDTVQTLVLLPLLLIGFGGFLTVLGGPPTIYERVLATDPALLSVTTSGVEFCVYIALALVGATVLNQGIWQRVYAAEDTQTVRRGFALAAFAVVPAIFLSGLFGLGAAGFGLAEHGGHTAFFSVLLAAAPSWLVVVVVAIAVLLVMTSADTLLSGLASLALRELPRIVESVESGGGNHDRDELLAVRALTALFAVAAIALASLQFDEIYMLLMVDLLSAATFVPVVVGLYTGEVPQWGAVAASVLGFAAGSAVNPTFQAIWGAVLPAWSLATLPTPSFTASFLLAVSCSAVVTGVAAVVSEKTIDLGRLERNLKRLGEESGGQPE